MQTYTVALAGHARSSAGTSVRCNNPLYIFMYLSTVLITIDLSYLSIYLSIYLSN